MSQRTRTRRFFPMLCARVFVYFRRSRMRRFHILFPLSSTERVLDIGGTEQTWTTESGSNTDFPVTLLNLRMYDSPRQSRFRLMQGDATSLPFADNSFDLAFSNSVIEHLGTWQQQKRYACEARRVACKLWIQTPARSFPIEAHLLAPYIQYLPKHIQHRLVALTPRGLLTPDEVHQIVDEVRLLTYREMQMLFPDCVILRERLFGLTKSYIAVRASAESRVDAEVRAVMQDA